MFIWNDEYCIGVPVIDEQHKEIFRICRELELLVQVPVGIEIKDDALKILCDLRNYVTFHFYEEENYMQSINYMMFNKHKLEHDNFRKEVVKADLGKISENKNEIQMLMNNVYSFLLNHVLDRDMKIGKDNLIF